MEKMLKVNPLLDYINWRIKSNKNLILIVNGSTGCLSHDTKLVGNTKTLGELYQEGTKFVDTISLTKQNKSAFYYHKSKSEIIDSGIKEVYEITLEDGTKVLATDEHKLFKHIKKKSIESEVKDLVIGDYLTIRNTKDILGYHNKKKLYEITKRKLKIKPKLICKLCKNEFEVSKLNKKYCNECKSFVNSGHMSSRDRFKTRAWSLDEDNLLLNSYRLKTKEQILKELPGKNWNQVSKRAVNIGLKRDLKFKYEPCILRNKFDNPAKRSEVREKKSKQMIEYCKHNPHKILNSKLRRNKITELEKIMKNILVNVFNLVEDKDFFFNHYMKVEGTYKFPDFIIPSKKLIIECDGEYWHNKSADDIRDVLFNQRGYKVLHFKGNQITKNINEVIEWLEKELQVIIVKR